MTSIQGRLLVFMMRNRHLLRFRLKPETWDFNTSIADFRRICEEGNARMSQMPQGVQIQPVEIGGLTGIGGRRAEWIIPADAPADKAILYTAGGGYVSGTCSDHRSFVARAAAACGIKVLLFDHRLAPEEPFPGALEDAVTAYNWLLEQGYQASDLLIMGESAGGGLCLATLLALKDQGIVLPAAAVALSPWTDLTLSGESYRSNARVCLAPPGMNVVCSQYYAGDNDRTHPWISPLFGDLHGLPPLYINVGGDETMLDDSTRFAQKAREAGVAVTLVVEKGMFHCYPLMAPLFPEATAALQEIAGFISEHLSVPSRA